MNIEKVNFNNDEEIKQLKKLFTEYFHEIDGDGFDIDNYVNDLKINLIKYPTLLLMTAIENNLLIGFIFGNTQYYYNNDNCGFILELFISKDFRNKGVAKALIKNFEKMCLNDKIYLTSAPNAIHFFEKVGYLNTGLIDKDNNLKIFNKNTIF